MTRRSSLPILILLIGLVAACGSSEPEATQALPTVMELPSITPSPIATETMEATEPPSPTPTETAVATGTAESPADPTPTQGVESQIVWRVSSVQPVSVFDCPKTDCTVVGMVVPGDILDVIAEGDEWHTIRFEDAEAYIFAGFVTRSDAPPTIAATGVDNAFPPGLATTSSGETPAFPPLTTQTPITVPTLAFMTVAPTLPPLPTLPPDILPPTDDNQPPPGVPTNAVTATPVPDRPPGA